MTKEYNNRYGKPLVNDAVFLSQIEIIQMNTNKCAHCGYSIPAKSLYKECISCWIKINENLLYK